MPLKPYQIAPSARITKTEPALIPRICMELAQLRITPLRWELQALARGTTFMYGDERITNRIASQWNGL